MFLAMAALAAHIACRTKDARYVLRGDPGTTAAFRAVHSAPDWPSEVVLAVRVPSGETYWWLPWDGGTDDQQNLASTTDPAVPGWTAPSPDGGPRPLGNLELLVLNGDYDILDAVPRRDGPAPAHLLLMHLGEAVWYHGTPPYRSRPAKAFFDLAGCATTAAPRRRPPRSRRAG